MTYAKNPNDKWYCYNDSSCKVRKPFPFPCPCRVEPSMYISSLVSQIWLKFFIDNQYSGLKELM